MPERKSSVQPNQDDKPQTDQAPKPQISRRGFLFGTGAGAAGLVVGGAAGSQVFPKETPKAAIVIPTVWVGRSLADCTGCRLCQVACSQAKENGKIWPAAARVTVPEYFPGGEFPVLCYQCGAA